MFDGLVEFATGGLNTFENDVKAPPICAPGEHDFGTGSSPCTKCLRDMKAAAVELREAVKNVTPDTIAHDRTSKIVRGPGWNRADEVALLYGLERVLGESDDSLHTRIRRALASGKVKYQAPPPMDWKPPANALPAPGGVQTYDMEMDDE